MYPSQYIHALGGVQNECSFIVFLKKEELPKVRQLCDDSRIFGLLIYRNIAVWVKWSQLSSMTFLGFVLFCICVLICNSLVTGDIYIFLIGCYVVQTSCTANKQAPCSVVVSNPDLGWYIKC